MAHTMKKFSRGGAQGKYDRRMADIEKDYAKAMTRKTGKAAEVAEAKRQQRIADAKDDFAKRTGADRTATRAAERLSEVQLKKTRKYGAPKMVSKDELIAPGKMTDSISMPKPKLDSSIGAKPAAAKPVVKKVADKPADKPVKIQRNYNISPENRAAIDAAAKKTPFSKFDKAAFSDLKTGKNSYGAASIGKPAPVAAKAKAKVESGPSTKRGLNPNSIAGMIASGTFSNPFRGYRLTNDADMRAYYKQQAKERAEGKAKGGKIMPKKPMPMGGKQLMPLKKKLTKEPITGGSDTVPATSERNEFRKEMMKRNATPGMSKGGKMKKYAAGGLTKQMPTSKQMGDLNMAKGGKAKMKPAAKGKAKSFAATKFGAAMMKKSADTKGRAMPKFAKGGSIDGCAVKGKTKTSMVKMARGGSPLMRKRDSYGGAMFKKGGKTC